MKITAWKDATGCWHARDFKWHAMAYGATREEAKKNLKQEIEKLEKEYGDG